MNFADYDIEIPLGATGQISTTCPKCSADRKKRKVKCLSVNADEGVWFCHHCEFTGHLEDKTHYQPLTREPKLFMKPQSATAAMVGLTQKHLDWFATRGISPETLATNRVAANESWIAFKYYRDGELVNIKWRDGKKNFRLEKGAELTLYGLDDIKNESEVVWVEGEMDKLTLSECGIQNCVSVPTGAPPANSKSYSSKFDYLQPLQKMLAEKTHILWFDSDEPGAKLEEEISRRLGKANCKRVIPPEDCKDANEVLLKHDKAKVTTLLEEAKAYPIAGIYHVSDFYDAMWKDKWYGIDGGFSTGWKCLDPYYTVKPGEWTLITGIPNSGKSNFEDMLLVKMAEAHGWRFGIFSPENQPLQTHARRIVEKHLNIPYQKCSDEQFKLGMNWAQKYFSWILPEDDESWEVNTILDKAEALVKTWGMQGLIIDPWNEMDHTRPPHLSESEYISKTLTQIRKFARRLNVHVWLVAHPTKLQKQPDGEYPCPTPYDVSGSAHWRNKADNCIAVHRYFTNKNRDKPIEVHVQKIRFKEIGKMGTVLFDYVEETNSYKQHLSFSG